MPQLMPHPDRAWLEKIRSIERRLRKVERAQPYMYEHDNIDGTTLLHGNYNGGTLLGHLLTTSSGETAQLRHDPPRYVVQYSNGAKVTVGNIPAGTFGDDPNGSIGMAIYDKNGVVLWHVAYDPTTGASV